MLTRHLRELEADGLIERIDFGEVPLRVEYQLSEMGNGQEPLTRPGGDAKFLADQHSA
jgi:DNA-binding HxlR family transcriptional regulator